MSASNGSTKPRWSTEDGVALVTALLGIIILGGLAVVFVATATTETRISGISRDYETAIHVAEAAIDDLIPQVNLNPDGFVSTDTDGDPFVFDPDDVTSLSAERAWAVAIAESVPEDELVELARGEGFAFRPVIEVGGDQEPMWAMYAVGWVPSRANPVRTRVVKMQFDSQRFRLDVGLLVGGPLSFGGNACVTGTFGGAHANADIHISGGGTDTPGDCGDGWWIEQTLSTSGEFTGHLSGVDCDSPPSAVGECEVGAEEYPIPRLRARTLYDMVNVAAPVDPPGERWYDLCPDGTVRSHGGSEPCTGTVRWDGKPGNNFRGWSFSDGWWQTHPGGGGGAHPGVYYVYKRNARVSHTSGSMPAVTVIAESCGPGDDPVICGSDGGGGSGHIVARAEARAQSALAGLTLVADRDIEITGNPQFQGLIIAHEQVQLGGEPIITGAVIAQDALNTIGSRVDDSAVLGEVTIIYDDELNPPLGGRIRITHWNEL